MLSGIQMIYQNETGNRLDDNSHTGICRICGGDLHGSKELSIKAISASWTDENNIYDLNSPYICEACQWMTSKPNGKSSKSLIWHGTPCMIVENNKTRNIEFDEFYQALINEDLTYPVLLAVHGKYKEATQKHIQWRSNRCVSYSPSHVRVAMSGMHVFDTGNRSKIDGIAQFDLKEWIAFAKGLEEKVRTNMLPYFMEKYTDRTKSHMIITRLINALYSSGKLNESTYLAAYLVGYGLFPSQEKEMKTA